MTAVPSSEDVPNAKALPNHQEDEYLTWEQHCNEADAAISAVDEVLRMKLVSFRQTYEHTLRRKQMQLHPRAKPLPSRNRRAVSEKSDSAIPAAADLARPVLASGNLEPSVDGHKESGDESYKSSNSLLTPNSPLSPNGKGTAAPTRRPSAAAPADMEELNFSPDDQPMVPLPAAPGTSAPVAPLAGLEETPSGSQISNVVALKGSALLTSDSGSGTVSPAAFSATGVFVSSGTGTLVAPSPTSPLIDQALSTPDAAKAMNNVQLPPVLVNASISKGKEDQQPTGGVDTAGTSNSEVRSGQPDQPKLAIRKPTPKTVFATPPSSDPPQSKTAPGASRRTSMAARRASVNPKSGLKSRRGTRHSHTDNPAASSPTPIVDPLADDPEIKALQEELQRHRKVLDHMQGGAAQIGMQQAEITDVLRNGAGRFVDKVNERVAELAEKEATIAREVATLRQEKKEKQQAGRPTSGSISRGGSASPKNSRGLLSADNSFRMNSTMRSDTGSPSPLDSNEASASSMASPRGGSAQKKNVSGRKLRGSMVKSPRSGSTQRQKFGDQNQKLSEKEQLESQRQHRTPKAPVNARTAPMYYTDRGEELDDFRATVYEARQTLDAVREELTRREQSAGKLEGGLWAMDACLREADALQRELEDEADDYESLMGDMEKVAIAERRHAEGVLQRAKIDFGRIEITVKGLAEATIRRLRAKHAEMESRNGAWIDNQFVLESSSDDDTTTLWSQQHVGVQVQRDLFKCEDVAEAAKFMYRLSTRERSIAKLVGTMDDLGKKVDSANRAQESILACPACRTVAVDNCTLWPCGHTFCTACILDATGTGDEGGISCPVCGTLSTEMPVPNQVVNSIAARMQFVRSGSCGLADALSTFKREALSIDKQFLEASAVHYRQLEPDMEYCTVDGVSSKAKAAGGLSKRKASK